MQHNEESQLQLKDEQTNFKEYGQTCSSKIDDIIKLSKDFLIETRK
jgi:hypothetical protein